MGNLEAGMMLRVVGSGALVMVSHIPAPERVAVFVDAVVSSVSRVVWVWQKDVEVVP